LPSAIPFLVKAWFVYLEIMLSGDILCDVKRKTVGIVQLEKLLSGMILSLSFS